MAFEHADYITKSTQAERIASLKLHVVEVTNLLALPLTMNIDGGWTREALTQYLTSLKAELRRMESAKRGLISGLYMGKL